MQRALDLAPGARVIFGFNTDVKFGDTVYHVQSEARKHERVLESQIFVKGRCIGKRATSYAEKVDESGFSEDQLHELLKEQHRHCVEAARAGRIEHELDAESTTTLAAAASESPPPILAAAAAASAAIETPAAELAPAAPSNPPGDSGLTLSAISGVMGKGLVLECLPPACAPDDSVLLLCVQVTDEAGSPACGAQLTCRISSGKGPASYAYATTGGSGVADLRIALPGLDLSEAALLLQASYREKSASRKYALRRSS